MTLRRTVTSAIKNFIGGDWYVVEHVQVDENEIEPVQDVLDFLLCGDEGIVEYDVSILLLSQLKQGVHVLFFTQILK
jgi:hypothetical protein